MVRTACADAHGLGVALEVVVVAALCTLARPDGGDDAREPTLDVERDERGARGVACAAGDRDGPGVVSGFASAHRRHGGDGALYVTLKPR